MGKFNELIKKIFNHNKVLRLPEGQENRMNTEVSEHSKFVNELRKQAKQYDLKSMPREDAIMKILEEHGLNSMFSKNPEGKKQIVEHVNGKLKDILRAESWSVETMKKTMEDMIISSENFTITDDGNLSYSISNKENHLKSFDNRTSTTDTTKYLSFFGDDLRVETLQKIDSKLYNGTRQILSTKQLDTYDKQGIQMATRYGEATHTYTTNKYEQPVQNPERLTYINSKGYFLKRNSNMETASYTAYESINPDTLEPQYTSNVEDKTVNVGLIMQQPEYLQPVETPPYEKLANGYKPEEIDLNGQNLKKYAMKSPRFKKALESKGLIFTNEDREQND